jgi:hypothetical protein
MAKSKFMVESEWVDDVGSLPTEADFAPFGDLDAQSAWKNFGGLSRSKVYERFQDNPLYYQEAFMWMGGVAFEYYYPVIERFLYDAGEDQDLAEDRNAWILACCINTQFDGKGASHVRHLSSRILALARYVRSNLKLYGSDLEEQQQVDTAWQEVESCVASDSAR